MSTDTGYDNKALNFLDGRGADQSGRTVFDYFKFGPEAWEGCHDVIQWAFPTKTKSSYNINTPTLPENIVYNSHDSALCINGYLQLLLESYLKSLCIQITGSPFSSDVKFDLVYNAGNYDINPWLNPGNHNYKRFTRILECLGCFGHSHMKQRFVEFLLYKLAPNYPTRINSDAVVFWMATWENKRDLILSTK